MYSTYEILSSCIMTSSFNCLGSDSIFVSFYRCWFLESRYPSVLVLTYHLFFLSSCIHGILLFFIDNLRTRNDEHANLVRYVIQQRRRTRFSHLRFPYQQLFIKDTYRQVLMRLALGPDLGLPGIEPEVALIYVILVYYYQRLF